MDDKNKDMLWRVTKKKAKKSKIKTSKRKFDNKKFMKLLTYHLWITLVFQLLLVRRSTLRGQP